jgi:hypothetical protein
LNYRLILFSFNQGWDFFIISHLPCLISLPVRL